MKTNSKQRLQKLLVLFFGIIVFGASIFQVQAAVLSPQISNQLNTLTDNVEVGMTIIAFDTTNGLNESHLNILRNIGINAGYKFNTLGMVATPLTVGQIRALNNNSNVRSIWSNDKLQYFMHEARVVTGVEKLRTDSILHCETWEFLFQVKAIFR